MLLICFGFSSQLTCFCLQLWVGQLLFYSSALYLLTSLIVYLLYLPEQWLLRLAMALPFFIYPVLWVFYPVQCDLESFAVHLQIMWFSYYYYYYNYWFLIFFPCILSVWFIRCFLIFLFSKRSERNSKLSVSPSDLVPIQLTHWRWLINFKAVMLKEECKNVQDYRDFNVFLSPIKSSTFSPSITWPSPPLCRW